eukprot:g1078.t1
MFDGFDALMDSSVEESHPFYYNQTKVYDALGKKVLATVTDGYSAALFAYGQTGSGKTTSVMGNLDVEEERGVLPRLLIDLFKSFDAKKAGVAKQVRCSILEIYNERLRDLLVPRETDTPTPKIDIRSHPKYGNYIPNLTQEKVSSLEEVMRCIEFARLNQTVAATQMNAKSSRAHTVFTFNVLYGDAANKDEHLSIMQATKDTTAVTLHFVDLAGRENEKTTLARGERLVELGFINKSLFHLSNCIQALGASAKGAGSYPKMRGAFDPGQVNYRNSKITMLLQESLSGNSRTYMLGTLSPAASAFDENAVTLRFAATVKNIKTQSSKVTGKTDDRIVALQEEVERLKLALQMANEEAQASVASSSNDNSSSSACSSAELQEQLDAVEAALREQTRTAEELAEEAKRLRRERQQMRVRLGIAKTQLAHEKQKSELLPFLSNESADQHQCGHLEYSFAHCGSWFIGSDFDACVQAAKAANQYEEMDTVPRFYAEHAIESEKVPNCAQLYGFQMAPVLCKITKVTNTTSGATSTVPPQLRLTLLAGAESGAAVCVNSATLTKPGEEYGPLQHGDKITLGRSFVFRVYLHATSASEEPLHTPRNRRSEFSTSTEVLEALRKLLPPEEFSDGFKLHHAKQFVSNLKTLSLDHEKKTRKYLYESCKLTALLQEAMTITEALRPQDQLLFELAHTAPIVYYGYPKSYVPQPIVRVARHVTENWQKYRLQNSGFVKTNAEHVNENQNAALDFEHHHHAEVLEATTETLFVWSVTKFLSRLEMMRDIYHAWQKGQELVVDLKGDPWVEAGPVEIEFWLQKHTKEILAEKDAVAGERDRAKEALGEANEKVDTAERKRGAAEERVKQLEAQLKAMAEVHEREQNEEKGKKSEVEIGLQKEVARLQIECEQGNTKVAELEHAHAEALLAERQQAKLRQASAEAETRRAREEVDVSLNKQKERLEKVSAEEKATLQRKFAIELETQQQTADELRQQLEAAKGTFEKRQLLEHERFEGLQEELRSQQAAWRAQMEKEKKELAHVTEAAVAAAKAKWEREKYELENSTADRDRVSEEAKKKFEGEKRELEAAVHQLQLEKEREKLTLEGMRLEFQQKLETVVREREKLRSEKEFLEAQIGQDESLAKLKRCMELSVANQKLLDQFFAKKAASKLSLSLTSSGGGSVKAGADVAPSVSGSEKVSTLKSVLPGPLAESSENVSEDAKIEENQNE